MRIRPAGGVSEVGKAAGHRLSDAHVLLANGRWRTAIYLAGYAVECRLKAKLMRKYGCDHLDDLGHELTARGMTREADRVFTHSLELLLNLTGRMAVLRADAGRLKQFNTVNRWQPAWRYTASMSDADEATDFVAAAADLCRWIENNV